MPLSPQRIADLRPQLEDAGRAISKTLEILSTSGIEDLSLAITLAGLLDDKVRRLPEGSRISVINATLLNLYEARKGVPR